MDRQRKQRGYNDMKIEFLKINDVVPADYNPRKLSDKQRDDIKSSLLRFGFVDPVIINRNPDRMNVVVGGHQRLKVWESMGNDTFPAVFVDLPLEKEKELNVRLNKNTGEWDFDILLAEFDACDLDDWGFEDSDFPEVEVLPPDETTGDDEVGEPPEMPRTVMGDLYELGGHRLLCGDSTSVDAVDELMDGVKPDLIHTDPPYGIGYGGSMALGQKKFGWKQHSGGWDESRPPKEFFDLAEAQCADRIIWGGNYFSDYLPPTMGWLVWDKGQRGFSLADGEMAWTSFDNAMRIKEFSRATANREEKHHATQKPLVIVEWALEYADRHAKRKPVLILDFFGGSGSTLIACEKTARKCFMMELDPKYCDVIVRRYVKFCKENGRKYSVMRNGEPCDDFEETMI
jgi:hypothetical protein